VKPKPKAQRRRNMSVAYQEWPQVGLEVVLASNDKGELFLQKINRNNAANAGAVKCGAGLKPNSAVDMYIRGDDALMICAQYPDGSPFRRVHTTSGVWSDVGVYSVANAPAI
jgi:hypothetical protein